MDYNTVFQISETGNASSLSLPVAVTFFAVAIGFAAIRLLIFQKRGQRFGVLPFLSSLGVIGFGVMWLYYAITVVPESAGYHKSLISAYRSGSYAIAEGEVHVLRTQPEFGHAQGDLIRVGDEQFVVDFFVSTPAYNRTIAYGGVLNTGALVRVFHVDGAIVRIDLGGVRVARREGQTLEEDSAEKPPGRRVRP